MSYTRWTIVTLLLSTLLLVLVGSFNYVVDPYGIYHFSGSDYNYQKSKDSDPYLIKAYQGKKYKPEAIVLGTSRSMRLNPPTIKSLTGETAYGLGVPAATPYIDLKYLEYAIRVDPNLKTVFLGLDFEVFNESFPTHANFNEKRLKSFIYLQDFFSSLLSEKALKDSRKVLIDNYYKTTTYTENRFLGDGSFDETLVFPPNTDQETLQALPTTYQLSLDSLDDVKQIKRLCDANGLRLYMYISPVHAILLETFWQNSLWNQFEEWKRQLVQIAPVWDFSGYHDISMSPLKHSSHYNDLSHFSKQVGDLILYRMLNKETDKVPAYFGISLTPDNIESNLAILRSNRSLWPERGKNLLQLLTKN
ncbi:conserved hypothetical protein [Paenibacillus curdlanolyticus YK9]|uniref:DUF1574 domain-containing protein n=1 Tax=Paenibacillus curdlanolyticus YK9 TaxID=717606 RepID=E0I9R8_9BACL|nr:hypothetical protein [Paenibacillus curdlanolyticus]EFM11152.1 conserved hypothetical protein [Paenibacillus curdlanolyticus YK9]